VTPKEIPNNKGPIDLPATIKSLNVLVFLLAKIPATARNIKYAANISHININVTLLITAILSPFLY